MTYAGLTDSEFMEIDRNVLMSIVTKFEVIRFSFVRLWLTRRRGQRYMRSVQPNPRHLYPRDSN